MTTPTYFNSAARCIALAMEDAGLLQEGAEPSSEAYAKNLGRLTDLVNLWQTQGLKLWLQEERTVTLVASTASYTVTGSNGERAMRVLQGYFRDSSGNPTPLTPISRDEYTRVSNQTTTGQPIQYFADKGVASTTVYFWPVPNTTAATGTARLIIQRQVTTLVSLTDSTAFPAEWFIALRWGLADEICTGQPQAIMDRCKAKADAFRKALEDWDVEDAPTRFQPDAQGACSRFR